MVKLKVRNGAGEVVDVVERIPRGHKGWDSVRYKGKRYQLFGGPFTYADYRINLQLPLGKRRR